MPETKDPTSIPLSFIGMSEAEFSSFKENVEAMSTHIDILEEGLSDADKAHISILEMKYQARKAAGKIAKVVK